MTPQIATAVYGLGILALFLFVRDPRKRTRLALWLPVTWLLINGARPVSFWLGIAPVSAVDQSLEGSPLDRVIYLALLLVGLGILWRRATTVSKFLRANPAILLFLLYCLLSIAWSDYPLVALKRWSKLLGDVVMVLIVLTEADRFTAIKRTVIRVAFILIPLSVLLIKYYPEKARYYSPFEGLQMVSGVAADKNMLGMTCLVYGLGVWWLLLAAYRDKTTRGRARQLIAYGTVMAMLMWLFHMANSMTSLSCFLMAAGMLAATSFFRFARKPAILNLMIAAMVGVSFTVLFLHVGGGALESMGRNATLTGRTDIWKALLAISNNPLVGAGFESFWVGDRLQAIWTNSGTLHGINEAHNGYLEIYLSLGWIGVALLVGLIVSGYRNIMSVFRRDPEVSRLRLAFFATAIVYAFTEAGFRIMCPVWTAFLLSIIAVPNLVTGRRPRPLKTGKFSHADAKLGAGLPPREIVTG